MLVYIVLIALYSIFVALSIYFLSSLRLFIESLSLKTLLSLSLNFMFWLGLFFALFARLTFVVINSQLSKLPVTQNANTSITFIVTLSSVVAVIALNTFVLGEKLTVNQIIGTIVIVVGILLMFK